MGRKSLLTSDQWIEIERRHVVDGESINSLAGEFDVNESSIRRKIKPNKAESPKGENPLRIIALRKIEADAEVKRITEQIAELPYAKQQIVSDLARKLTNISEHLASAAEYGSMTAHRLAMVANLQLDKIDETSPEKNAEVLQGIRAMTNLSNEAASTGLNLLRANQDYIGQMNTPPVPPSRDIPAGTDWLGFPINESV